MRFVRTEVLKIRQESWLFYRQFFQDFAAIATKFKIFKVYFDFLISTLGVTLLNYLF